MRQIVAPKGGQCGAAPKILAIPMVQAYRFSAMGSPCELQIYAENHAVAERVANLAMADLRKVVPSIEVPSEEAGFRSLSVVSNRYCAIAYVSTDAPRLLRDNVGRAMEHFET